MKKILVVDDELGTRESLSAIFWNTHQVLLAESADEAFGILKRTPVDLLILDIIMPGKDGIEFLGEVRKIYPSLPVIMVSAVNSTSTMAEAIRIGAVDFISKPFDVADVRTIADRSLACADMRRQCEVARREALLEYPLHRVVGESPVFRAVMNQAQKLASSEQGFLITGERGTGTELLARYVHSLSARTSHPFITLHCSALPESLLEVEIFGKVGSLPEGIQLDTMGAIDLASSGILLLKEAHMLPESIQKRLAHLLREHVFHRSGGDQNFAKSNVRIIFTSSLNMGEVRSTEILIPELQAALGGKGLQLPPLRERKEDIPLLVHLFISFFRQRMNVSMSDVDSRAMELLRSYSWPGNVKELRSVVERVMVVFTKEPCLLSEHLPHDLMNKSGSFVGWPKLQGTLEDTVNALQRDLIAKALTESKGRSNRAAKLLGTTPRVLNYRIKQLKLKVSVK